MDVDGFIEEIRDSADYAGQIVYVREVAGREAVFAETSLPLPPPGRRMLAARGVARLYQHQAQAIDCIREGRSVVVATAGEAGGGGP